MTATESVLTAFAGSTDKLITTLEQFPAEKFNTIPSEGSWSVGMVADHLLKLEKRINHIIISPGKRAEREPDEKVDHIRTALENMTVKLRAPSFLNPVTEPVERDSLLAELRQQKERLLRNAEIQDLTEICADFPHNRLGELTRLEWIWFNVYHTDRHIQQLKNIAGVLEDTTA